MTPIIPSLSPLFEFQLPRNISGTDFGTGYGGTVCGFHTRRPTLWTSVQVCLFTFRAVTFSHDATRNYAAAPKPNAGAWS